MIKVRFASSLRPITGVAETTVDSDQAPTVRRLIRVLDERYPGIGEHLGEGTAVAIDGDIIPDAIYEDIPDGAEIDFLPAISGG